MNDQQRIALSSLRKRLAARREGSTPLEIKGESREGFIFTAVDGVTVTVGPKGGLHIPAVRNYAETRNSGEKAIDAVIDAYSEWKKQGADPTLKTGHFGRLVDTDWKCSDSSCPCQSEPYEQRLSRSL